jgi:hypothetical protein
MTVGNGRTGGMENHQNVLQPNDEEDYSILK